MSTVDVVADAVDGCDVYAYCINYTVDLNCN